MSNLTHNSFLCIYLNSLHVSSNLVLIIRRISYINTTSGICHSVTVTFSCAGRKGILFCVFVSIMYMFRATSCSSSGEPIVSIQLWYTSLCVDDRFVCETAIDTEWHTVYQMLYWYNWFSWWWARVCSKHVENWNKYIEKNCASSWSFTKNP